MKPANAYRGEAALCVRGESLLIRPSFEALVGAEAELGPLFAMVERASEGRMTLSEIVALFDHLSAGRPAAIGRSEIGEAVVEQGLVAMSPILKAVLGQILQGQ